MKILISWQATDNDYVDNQPLKNGPNYNFHLYHYHYDRHLILSSEKTVDARFEGLINYFRSEFPSHVIDPVCLGISDVFDLDEVKVNVEALLLEHKDDKIDIFYSTGTSAMKIAWYICHVNLGLRTRLLQLRHPKDAKNPLNPDIIETVVLKQSPIPVSAMIRQNSLNGKYRKPEPMITPSIIPIYEKAEKIAFTHNVTALITGESGTGKEHLAKYIHEKSVRRTKPYKAVNCSAFKDELLESRLFGFKKGSFTDAKEDTKGLIELAEGGTLFLDEIGDISPYMQQVLLRVLQEREVTPIQGETRQVDVRFLAATNKDLAKLCAEGLFRWDLYYRLCVVELELPSLVQRGAADLKLMINYFLKTKATQFKRKQLKLSPQALDILLVYSYPGNIRELENIIDSLYVFCTDTVMDIDLPKRLLPPEKTQLSPLIHSEKTEIENMLRLNRGNQRQTALKLGIAINTLRAKIQKYGIKIKE